MVIIADNRAITPPGLFTIDLTYSHKVCRYHSGWVWVGVTREFAFLHLEIWLLARAFLWIAWRWAL